MMLAPPDRCLITELADVVMVNRYYGWYVDAGDLDAAERAGGRAAGVGGEARQADPRHRVRRRHRGRAALPAPRSVERGVPGRAAGHVPPGVRPDRRRRRGARVELRRLRHGASRSSGWTATRRACSPATGTRRPPPTTCVAAGGPTSARDRARRAPYDQGPRQLDTGAVAAQELDSPRSGLAGGHRDGGEGRCRHGRHRHVVAADDADVSGNRNPALGQARDDAEGHLAVEGQDRRGA